MNYYDRYTHEQIMDGIYRLIEGLEKHNWNRQEYFAPNMLTLGVDIVRAGKFFDRQYEFLNPCWKAFNRYLKDNNYRIEFERDDIFIRPKVYRK